MSLFLARKLTQRHVWQRIVRERLTEPLHLNLWSAFVALFGSYRAKIEHDLIVRPHNAYCILQAADYARYLGLRTISLLEFGVASGAGLLNMAKIAEAVTRITGVEFKLYGFDTGAGMPAPLDYRDHPDLYRPADFPMDVARLRAALPANTQLVLGDVSETVPRFLASLDAPIGYVVFDLDYYSSTRAALAVLAGAPENYLPVTHAYFDDIHHDRHNSACGELLAIKEFNAAHPMRRLERHAFLRQSRIYQRASWPLHVFYLHALDHPHRLQPMTNEVRELTNPYL